ncbi:MAG: hypothetical protein ACRDF4_11940 [Rhabdochlamydiaceae bacterium]
MLFYCFGGLNLPGWTHTFSKKDSGIADRAIIRPLKREELSEPDKILRLAFGTFLRLPDPMQVFADKQMLVIRWLSNPDGVLAAELDGKIIGSNVATSGEATVSMSLLP